MGRQASVSEHLKTLKSLKSLDIRHLKLLKSFKSLDITQLSLEFKEILWTSTWHTHCHEDHSNQKRNEKNMRIGSSVQFGAISVWFGEVSIKSLRSLDIAQLPVEFKEGL
jgi:hypothetical protein